MKTAKYSHPMFLATSTFCSSIVVLASTLALSFIAIPATAQSDAARAIYLSAATVPTAVAGIRTYPEPPKGFNPIVASDEDLATYGFPPRPDKLADPDHRAKWERAMLVAKKRSTTPLHALSISSREMMPARQPAAAAISAGPSTSSSLNWSGLVNTNTRTTFSPLSSFTSVNSVWNVPVAQPPFGACAGGITGPFYEVSWNGIDGWKNGDVLQGGSYSASDCSGNTAYLAWIEWYPSYPIVEVFPINPGDDMYVQTFDTLGGTNPGNVYVEDLTTLTFNTYQLSYVTGPGLVGNSAEWIVERPCCNADGYPLALANIYFDFFDESWANLGNGKQFYPGSTSLSTYNVSMVDDGDTQKISVVNAGTGGYQGKYSLWFQITGCAFTPGCVAF
jgi:hypothetical protein